MTQTNGINAQLPPAGYAKLPDGKLYRTRLEPEPSTVTMEPGKVITKNNVTGETTVLEPALTKRYNIDGQLVSSQRAGYPEEVFKPPTSQKEALADAKTFGMNGLLKSADSEIQPSTPEDIYNDDGNISQIR